MDLPSEADPRDSDDVESDENTGDELPSLTSPTPSTSKDVKIEPGETGEPVAKKARRNSWICSSDEKSDFLDEFDSDEYTFSADDDGQELKARLQKTEDRMKKLENQVELMRQTITETVPAGRSSTSSLVATNRINFQAAAGTEVSLDPDLELTDEEMSNGEDERMFHNELEVASIPDGHENPIENTDSSSSADDDSAVTVPSTQQRNPSTSRPRISVDDNLADGEEPTDMDSETDEKTSTSHRFNTSDSELSDKDKWVCLQCHAKSLPHFRYCLRCFRIRRNWLPPRPRSRRLKKRKWAERYSTTDGNLPNPSIESGEDQVDGPPPPRLVSCPLPSTSSVDLNRGFLVEEDNEGLDRLDSSSFPGNITLAQLLTPPDSQEVEVDMPPPAIPFRLNLDTNLSKPETVSISTISGSNICTVCYVREKNSAFVHNKIAHNYCCYPCADRILKKDGKCPICREKVLRVVKIISV